MTLVERSDELVQLAVIQIGAEEYAIDIMRIKSIIQPLKITKVPRAPRFVEGVVELRGAILPIVDLRKRFDVTPGPVTRTTKYVIVLLGERLIGLIVDAVIDVQRVPRDDVKPPPELGFSDAPSFFSGVCHLGERIIMVLDLDQILTRQERIQLGAPLAPAEEGSA